MTYGLRIRNAAGKITLDSNFRMGRILGQIQVSSSGSMSVPAFSQGTPFVMVHQDNANRYAYITADASGTTLSWTLTSVSGSAVATLSYGVY